MARAVRRGVRRGSSKPTPGTWARFVDIPIDVSVSSKVLLATFVLSNVGIGETIRRTLGGIYVVSDQSAADEPLAGAFGMIVVSDLAGAAGAASIPGPFTDASDDGWFVWQGFSGEGKLAATPTNPPAMDKLFDSKGMRRVSEGFLIALMVENASSTAVFNIGTYVSLYSTRS